VHAALLQDRSNRQTTRTRRDSSLSQSGFESTGAAPWPSVTFGHDLQCVVRVIAARHQISRGPLSWQLVCKIREALVDIGLAARWKDGCIGTLMDTIWIPPIDGHLAEIETRTIGIIGEHFAAALLPAWLSDRANHKRRIPPGSGSVRHELGHYAKGSFEMGYLLTTASREMPSCHTSQSSPGDSRRQRLPCRPQFEAVSSVSRRSGQDPGTPSRSG
jgi:hypothetical protein